MNEPDFDTFSERRRGHFFEDFSPGQVFVHHWGRTLTASDNITFSTATCCWNPMNLNAVYVRAHGHDDVVVNPMLVLCTVVGLSVEDLSEVGGPFLGIDDCTIGVTVQPGDTVTATSTVVEARPARSRPGFGIVTWDTCGYNQRAESVVRFRRTNLVAMKRVS